MQPAAAGRGADLTQHVEVWRGGLRVLVRATSTRSGTHNNVVGSHAWPLHPDRPVEPTPRPKLAVRSFETLTLARRRAARRRNQVRPIRIIVLSVALPLFCPILCQSEGARPLCLSWPKPVLASWRSHHSSDGSLVLARVFTRPSLRRLHSGQQAVGGQRPPLKVPRPGPCSGGYARVHSMQ